VSPSADDVDASHLGTTERTKVRRAPERAHTDRQALADVLDAGLIAHVGIVDDSGQPFVLPVAYARDGDRVIIHGSTASRLFRQLAAGTPACLSVTLLDGIVVARSAFESSMNYRSALVLGRFTRLEGEDAATAVSVITEHLIPGRTVEVRANLKKELAATLVLSLDLTEASVKIRVGGPIDDAIDLGTPVWAGVVPLRQVSAAPIAADAAASELPIPTSVHRLLAKHS